MKKPFRTFMENMIDYAGLFPPASLSLDEAIRNYARYRKSGDAWMLARFIVPARRLAELAPYKAILFQEGDPFRFSMLGRGGKDGEDFLSGLAADLKMLGEFLDFHGERVKVDAFEVRLPEPLLRRAEAGELTRLLNQVAVLLEKGLRSELHPFYEGDFTQSWREQTRALVKALADHNRYISGSGQFAHYRSAGLKIRCGGEEASRYPTPEQLAYAVETCLKQRVAMKATAGLHHPLRHNNRAAGVKMHGFLNLFTAAIAAEAHTLEMAQIREILEDEDAGNFIFTTRAFAWHNLRISQDEIQHGREKIILSFGSCSFDEPREDLRRLKLL